VKQSTRCHRRATERPKSVSPKALNDARSDLRTEDPAGWLSWRGPWLPALVSGLLLWAAFPPLGWWPLVWIAPLGWLRLILVPQLPGRRPYWAIWLAGMLHWAVVLQGIRLAHPALYLGWISLSAYLAVYPTLFVGLTRVAVHRLGISVVLAAPIVWTGLELLRGYALTGLSMAPFGSRLIPADRADSDRRYRGRLCGQLSGDVRSGIGREVVDRLGDSVPGRRGFEAENPLLLATGGVGRRGAAGRGVWAGVAHGKPILPAGRQPG
jgi:hypothetical protein